MNAPQPVEDHAIVVLLGSFNPAIFHPGWFAAKGLIRDSEAAGAENPVVTPDVASFRAGWLHLMVTRERFQATATDPAHHVLLRDLVVGAFHLLEHTPASVVGMTRAMHFRLPDADAWHAVGHLVMPKDPWEGLIERPGLRTLLAMGERPGGRAGKRFVTIEPSAKHPTDGVFIAVTDDVPAPADAKFNGVTHLVDVLEKQWDQVQREGLDVAQILIDRARKQEQD